MSARVVARTRIAIPCIFPPLAVCKRGEAGIIYLEEGRWRIPFAQRYSSVPTLAITGVGIWELVVRIFGRSYRLGSLPIPMIVYRVTRQDFYVWLPKGKGYLTYLAFESDSREERIEAEIAEQVELREIQVNE